jgi:hypothetical protein
MNPDVSALPVTWRSCGGDIRRRAPAGERSPTTCERRLDDLGLGCAGHGAVSLAAAEVLPGRDERLYLRGRATHGSSGER